MTADLYWLTLTAILAATLWLPYIVGVNMTRLPAPAENRPTDPAALPAWIHRAWRAHLNLLEQFLPFAVVVLVAHLSGASNGVTAGAAAAFFGLRLVHAVWMIGGLPVLPARPLIFTAGWVAILVVGWQVLAA